MTDFAEKIADAVEVALGDDGHCIVYKRQAVVAAIEQAARQPQERGEAVALSVWYGAMPETNGKTNWTAILVRDGDITSGYTFARSEYEDRVRYEADSMRFLIGEISERPDLMAYDPNKHSGYVYPPSAEAARIAALESQLAESREREGLALSKLHAATHPEVHPRAAEHLIAEAIAALAANKEQKPC